MNKLITAATLVLATTAFVSCELEPEPDPTPNPTPDNRTDFEKLSDDVANLIIDGQQCKLCHESSSNDSGITSELNFEGLTGDDAVNGLAAYINDDNPGHAVIAKQKPNGLLDHFGGAKLKNNNDLDIMWSEFVDQVAQMNPPELLPYSEALAFVRAELIVNDATHPDGCFKCHGPSPLASNAFSMVSDSELEIEAGITAYLETAENAKVYMLGKPNGLYDHIGNNAINNDSDKIKSWNQVVENLDK